MTRYGSGITGQDMRGVHVCACMHACMHVYCQCESGWIALELTSLVVFFGVRVTKRSERGTSK